MEVVFDLLEGDHFVALGAVVEVLGHFVVDHSSFDDLFFLTDPAQHLFYVAFGGSGSGFFEGVFEGDNWFFCFRFVGLENGLRGVLRF